MWSDLWWISCSFLLSHFSCEFLYSDMRNTTLWSVVWFSWISADHHHKLMQRCVSWCSFSISCTCFLFFCRSGLCLSVVCRWTSNPESFTCYSGLFRWSSCVFDLNPQEMKYICVITVLKYSFTISVLYLSIFFYFIFFWILMTLTSQFARQISYFSQICLLCFFVKAVLLL